MHRSLPRSVSIDRTHRVACRCDLCEGKRLAFEAQRTAILILVGLFVGLLLVAACDLVAGRSTLSTVVGL